MHAWAMRHVLRHLRGWVASFKRGPRLAQWCLVGAALVSVFCATLVLIAYCGITLGLGTHDKSALVTAAVAMGAFLFAAVAAALAMAAFWAASGTPDLLEMTLVNGEPAQEEVTLVNPSALVIGIELVNRSKYSARNPGVRVSIFGFSSLQLTDLSWRRINPSTDGSLHQFQWDGGTENVHGGWSRRLPDLQLAGSQTIDRAAEKHELKIEYVADGVAPKVTTRQLSRPSSTPAST